MERERPEVEPVLRREPLRGLPSQTLPQVLRLPTRAQVQALPVQEARPALVLNPTLERLAREQERLPPGPEQPLALLGPMTKALPPAPERCGLRTGARATQRKMRQS